MNRFNVLTSHTATCGCGREAQFAVYEDKQPHCLSCKNDAVDCKVKILVEVL